ncbi:D-ribose-binding periplasmic protein precursor [Roseibium album]|nr:D-ribose-binding periplasmic protein precursor [Roseibium album]
MCIRSLTAVFVLLCASLHVQASCIGVIPAGAEHLFWREVIRGAETAAKEEKLLTYVRSPNTETNEAAQKYIIEKALDEGCKGIVLAPNSLDILSSVPRLAELGTPVVYVDRDMGGAPISVVKTNNFNAGALAGREMAKRLNGKGTVALLRMLEGVISTTERETGFLHALNDTDIEVVHDGYIGSTVGEARENTALLFQSGLQVDAIFTPNESSTIGALLTLKQMGLAGQIHHIGFDFTPLLLAALKSNEISGLVVQHPFRMGYLGTKTLIKALNNEAFGKTIDIPVHYIDLSNLNDPEVQEVVAVEYE